MAVQQVSGIRRTDLQRHDLSVAGREVVQVRVDIAPGARSVKHTHPGEEIIYVLEGSLEYEIDGKPSTTYKAGDALLVAADNDPRRKECRQGERRGARNLCR